MKIAFVLWIRVLNDDSDDTAALLAAVEEAKASGKSVYIPEGLLLLTNKLISKLIV